MSAHDINNNTRDEHLHYWEIYDWTVWGDITGRHVTCPVKGRPGSEVMYREAKKGGVEQ